MTRRARAVPPVLLLLLALPACGGADEPAGSEDGAAPTTSASAPSSPSAEQPPGGDDPAESPAEPDGTDGDGDDGAPPFPADTEPDLADPAGEGLASVTDIRIGRHEGFDRVVFETDGAGTPGWRVEYVDRARSQGSGTEVDLDGAAVLQVTLTGVGYPFDTGVEEYAGPRRLAARDTEVVTEVVWDSTFEGQSVAFAGVTEKTPFRVYLLEAPTRVVLEVADPR